MVARHDATVTKLYLARQKGFVYRKFHKFIPVNRFNNTSIGTNLMITNSSVPFLTNYHLLLSAYFLYTHQFLRLTQITPSAQSYYNSYYHAQSFMFIRHPINFR